MAEPKAIISIENQISGPFSWFMTFEFINSPSMLFVARTYRDLPIIIRSAKYEIPIYTIRMHIRWHCFFSELSQHKLYYFAPYPLQSPIQITPLTPISIIFVPHVYKRGKINRAQIFSLQNIFQAIHLNQ